MLLPGRAVFYLYSTFKSDKKCCKYKEILIVFYIGIGKTVWYNVRGLCNIELMGSGKRVDNGKEKIGKEKNGRVKNGRDRNGRVKIMKEIIMEERR